ncbi:hypothetical protein INT45_004544 [Circinella minor]|uniref:F-box domain-containing protein n=1 Tax=Circinella minor TaxID=1195481 RepID=A0A8H7S3M0_9FUNG|nr:hypothetical protein INT45_004544 [Circinella minor]
MKEQIQTDVFLPNYSITNSSSNEASFEKVKNAISEFDYEKTINLALTAINTIKRTQLTIAYDHRVYGRIQQYKYEAAVQDIEKIIEYNPDLGTNYFKLANVLDLQGKQEKVYQVCDEALKKKKTSEKDSLYGQLVQLKNAANEKRTRRIDPLAVLPVKLDERIFTALTTKDLVTLMYISSLWRQRVLQCEAAWETVSDIPNHRPNALRVLPQVAKYIKKMTLCTEKTTIMSRYLEFIDDGVFTKIESLSLKVSYIKAKNMEMLLTSAFWKIRSTLTCLSLEVPNSANPVKLAAILFYCKNLKVLEFRACKGSLASALGDLELLGDSHKLLIDLRLSVPQMTGQSLKSLIHWCPNIRRLILDNTFFPDNVIDIILNDCTRLEILGYCHTRNDNNIFYLDDLNTNNNNDSSNNGSNKSSDIIKNNPTTITATSTTPHQSSDNNAVGQLRILSTTTRYIYYNTSGVPSNQLMQLLQKHQKSLERIYVNMAITNEQQVNGEPHPFIPYIDVDVLIFDRLEHLSYVADIYGVMEKLFLSSIESSHSSLKTFEAIDSFNIPAIVDTLIKIPPVQKLKFLFCDPKAKYNTFQYYFGDEDQQQQQDDVTAEQSMVQLFKSYASFCNNPHLSLSIGCDNSTRVLETVSFKRCKFITDNVLDALAEIKTLKVLKFEEIDTDDKITSQGFKSFLIKLGQNTKIAQLQLDQMNNVFKKYHGDDILRLIGKNMAYLEMLNLENLYHITYKGFEDMLNAIKGKKLRSLALIGWDEDSDFEDKIRHHIKKHDSPILFYIEYNDDMGFGLFD